MPTDETLAVVDEFVHAVDEIHALYLECSYAFAVAREHLADFADGFSDDERFQHQDVRHGSLEAVVAHTTTVGDVRRRIADDGPSLGVIARYSLLLIFQWWESEFRPRIARNLHLESVDDLEVPVLGDLRRLRNDILHNKARLSAETRSHLRALSDMFTEGATITPNREQVTGIVRRIHVAMDHLIHTTTGRRTRYSRVETQVVVEPKEAEES